MAGKRTLTTIANLQIGINEGLTNALDFRRVGQAYNFNMDVLEDDEPALEPFQISPYTFKQLDNIYPTVAFDPAMEMWDYSTALNNIKSFATEFADQDWLYTDLCAAFEPLQSTLEHPALSYKLDSGRPILIIQSATHGNEKHSLPGILAFFRELMTSDREDMTWVRNNLAIMAVCIHNPNGWNLDRRRNGTDLSSVYNGVNLNRNWDYFWEYAADQDKGTEPFSEIENRNFRNWLETNDRIAEGLLFLDFHSWWSRPIYALLTDHNFQHGMKIQTMQRGIWRYSNFLMKNRNWDGYTLNGGINNMVLSERSSTRKPYAPYWGQQRMSRYKGYCCQFEIPQGDESQAVNAQVIIDVLTACSWAMRDHMQPERLGLKIDKAVAVEDILNTNSLFTDWSLTYNRPKYFRSEGVVLVQNNGLVDIHRPLSASWPRATFDSASCVYLHPTDETKSFLVVAGGQIEGNVETSAVYLEMLVPPPPPPLGSNEYGIYKARRPQVKIASLPEPIKSGAMVYCNGYIWHFMGHKGVQGYELGIYRLPVTTNTSDVANEMDFKQWQFVKNTTHYTDGLQRHRVIALGTDIVIIGGRGETDYYRDIVKFDTTDFSETLVGQVGYKNGWFGIEQIPDTNTFLYFGGWAGALTKNDVFTIDFTDINAPAITRVASMPSNRRAFSWGLDAADNVLYIASGEVSDGVFTTDILAYDIVNDVWATLTQSDTGAGTHEYAYSKELDDEEESFDLANLNVTKAASVYNPYTRTLNIIAGEIDDGTGSAPTITFFEFNTEELALSARKVNDVTWGLLKPSSSKPITDGHLSTVVASVKNEMQWVDPAELKINPYVRSLNYVGPTWSATTRWRHKYLIAPRLLDVAVPVYAPEPANANSRIYAYLRLHGEGTKISSRGLQIIDNKLLTPRLVPAQGMAEERAIYHIGHRIRTVQGAFFTPLNDRFDERLAVARFTGESFIVELIHTLNSTAQTGELSVVVKTKADNQTLNTYALTDFVPNFDLYTNMYKRDVINFMITNKKVCQFGVWIYGQMSTVTLAEVGNDFNCQHVEANFESQSRVGIGFYLSNVSNV